MKALTLFWRRLLAPLDPWLMLFFSLLLGFSLTLMLSASPERLQAQLLNMAVALLSLRIGAELPPQKLLRIALPLFLVSVLLLVAVALFGDVSKGARRWLELGFMRAQPSELLKIATPLMLAWYFQRHEEQLGLREYVVASLILVLPVALIVRQPDLGTALLVLASGLFVIFFAGLPWRIIVLLGALAAAIMPLVWQYGLHDYQRHRVLTLFNPESDPLGKGFHIIQSTIAIGSGGTFGKGWGQGTQTQLEFLPERHTDFIFAVISEEFGLVGNALLLLLYLLLLGRCLVIAANAPTLFTRLLAGSITMIFFTYALVNMGMVSGVLPVVGVPLPFISYGGTALVTLSFGIGIMMSVNKHRMLLQK